MGTLYRARCPDIKSDIKDDRNPEVTATSTTFTKIPFLNVK